MGSATRTAARAGVLASLAELPEYRQVLFNLVARDLKVKYQRSALGFVWTLLYPAIMLGIYCTVFGLLLRFNIPNYWAYLIAGLIPFQFLVGAIVEGSGAIRANAGLIRKIYFPAELLVVARVTSKLVEFLLQLLVGIVFLLAMHHGARLDFGISIYKTLVVLPGAVILLYLFALGVALPLASYSVVYKDLEHVVGLSMTAWFYVTPIFWSLDLAQKHAPDAVRWFALNPAVDIVCLFRAPLYYGTWPTNPALAGTGGVTAWVVATLAAGLTLCCGYCLFDRSKRVLAEVV